jgi:hypothetical protein
VFEPTNEWLWVREVAGRETSVRCPADGWLVEPHFIVDGYDART